jgi:hypothetical protein
MDKDIDAIVRYSSECDDWDYVTIRFVLSTNPFQITHHIPGEKYMFQMWTTIQDFDAFYNDYCVPARNGSKHFDGSIIMLSSPYTTSDLDDERMLAVLLHHIADCAVPASGHAPSADRSNQTDCETLVEFTARELETRFSECSTPYAVASQDPESREYWNDYCAEFKKDIINISDNICIVGKNCDHPDWASQLAYVAAMKLARLVLPRYLKNTKRYLNRTPVALKRGSNFLISSSFNKKKINALIFPQQKNVADWVENRDRGSNLFVFPPPVSEMPNNIIKE